MKITKVKVVNLILSILLCDLNVYQSPSLHSLQASQSASLHSLHHLSILHCIRNGSSNGDSHSFQLTPVEGGHGDVATLQNTLQTHNEDRGRASSLC